MNTWVDITRNSLGELLPKPIPPEDEHKLPEGMPEYRELPREYGNLFWFDERDGRLLIRLRYFQPRFNALCITYRYGSAEPVPAGIKRLCNLIVATNILAMDFYSVKVGMGGDISGLRDQAMSRWQDEINRLYSSYQRSCSVHSLYR